MSKGFAEINEERRLKTKQLIDSGKYQFRDGSFYTPPSFTFGWDKTNDFAEFYRTDKPDLVWGKKKKVSNKWPHIKKSEYKRGKTPETITSLLLPKDQIGIEIISGKGYPYALRNGDVVHVLFFVRGPMKEILERDKKCLHCPSTVLLTRDHILPKAKGGGNHPENLQILCLDCNGKKAAKVPKSLTIVQKERLKRPSKRSK